MSLPLHWDTRRGIKKWLPLGNIYLGDCVVAARYHLTMIQNLAAASTWGKLLYKLGYRPPTNGFAKADYTQYLATLNEKPSGTQGVDPSSYFAWLLAQGQIKEWKFIPLVAGSVVSTIHEAMYDWDGCLVTLGLTTRAYQEGISSIPWTIEPGEVSSPTLGHAVADVSYGPSFDGVVTWGFMKSMSSEFMEACCWGCYVFN